MRPCRSCAHASPPPVALCYLAPMPRTGYSPNHSIRPLMLRSCPSSPSIHQASIGSIRSSNDQVVNPHPHSPTHLYTRFDPPHRCVVLEVVPSTLAPMWHTVAESLRESIASVRGCVRAEGMITAARSHPLTLSLSINQLNQHIHSANALNQTSPPATTTTNTTTTTTCGSLWSSTLSINELSPLTLRLTYSGRDIPPPHNTNHQSVYRSNGDTHTHSLSHTHSTILTSK